MSYYSEMESPYTEDFDPEFDVVEIDPDTGEEIIYDISSPLDDYWDDYSEPDWFK